MNEIFETIGAVFKVIIGVSVVDFFIMNFLPHSDPLGWGVNTIRIILSFTGIAATVISIYYMICNYRLRKKIFKNSNQTNKKNEKGF